MKETRGTGAGRFFCVQPVVFGVSTVLIVIFSAAAMWRPRRMEAVFTAVQAAIVENAGWFYILAVDAVLVFVVFLLFSRYGHVRLGGDDEKPAFPYITWLSMLFSAGMGIGLLFWSVAEPISHLVEPPRGLPPMTPEAAAQAMKFTFFHWGLHAWGIYAVVGVSLAYFGYRRGLPLTIRSAFHPLLGDRIHGMPGHVIDILAVLATIFGVATSLGFGVLQINAGLDKIAELHQTEGVQLTLIALITLVATISVVTGVRRGIRRLSELNLLLAGVFLLFCFLAGPTVGILQSLIQTTGAYISQLPRLSTWTDAYAQTGWQNGWTIFYWGWWIAWSPFVGMFIARISRGRTIREFIGGVLLVPASLTFVWLSVFGGAALRFELAGDHSIGESARENVALSLFVFLEHLPLAGITSGLAVLIVLLFFITSSDSGSLVVDMITSGGNPNPPVWQRIFWAVMEGLVAAALLITGGLAALQTASITLGLPFAVVLLFMVAGLYKALRTEPVKQRQSPSSVG